MALSVVAMVGAVGCGSNERATGGSAQDSKPASQGNAESGSGSGGSGSGSGSGSGAPDQGASQQQPASADQRKVIRAAQVSIRVDDVPAATREVAALGPRFGGYVADEDASESRSTVQLKVESAKLDDVLGVLDADIGEVSSRKQQATDVTEQAVDLQARIAAQRASVDRVRTLLSNATTIGEIVQIESELTARQAELDSLEQRLSALDGQAELAVVTVTLYRSSSPLATDEEADTGFLAGLAAGWRAFVGAAEIGLTVFGALLPFLVALAIPVTLVVWLVRRGRKPAQAPAPAQAGPPSGA